jgi:hypothetical protein
LQLVTKCPYEPLVSPDDRWLITWNKANDPDIWLDGQQHKQPALRSTFDRKEWVGESPWCAFSPDSRMVINFRCHGERKIGPVQAVASGRPSKMFTTENAMFTGLWDVERGEELATNYRSNRALISPDGNTLVTVEPSDILGVGLLRLWRIPPSRAYGTVLALTTAAWSLFLLVCWAVKRLLRRKRPAALAPAPLSPLLPEN